MSKILKGWNTLQDTKHMPKSKTKNKKQQAYNSRLSYRVEVTENVYVAK